jgi:hypothetical protein
VGLVQTVLPNSKGIHQKERKQLEEVTRVKMEHPMITTMLKPSNIEAKYVPEK